MSEIKIVKEKKATDYTFIDDTLSLGQATDETRKNSSTKSNSKSKSDIKLRNDSKVTKIKHKSKITGGHSMQGHSPVYE